MLVKSATRLNNISRLRSKTRWNRSSRLVSLLKSRTAHYVSLAVYSFSHFFRSSFFSRYNRGYVTSRLTLGERNEIAATRTQKPAATSFLLLSCVKRAWHVFTPLAIRLTMRFLILRDSRRAADLTRTIALYLIELHTADWIDVIVRLIYLRS